MKSNLYWITGLSGAGKTTIGTLLYSHLKKNKDNVIFLDGDALRKIFGVTDKYSISERKILAMSYSRLCKYFVEQNIDVVIATISMFHEVREWNCKNIENYNEIYIKVPIQTLINRDQKKLYVQSFARGIKGCYGCGCRN